jgi:flagellin-like protein
MKQKRKAISPIIATLILIVITVIAGIFLYSFVSGYLGTLSGTTNQPPPNVQFIASSVKPGSNGEYIFTFTAENLGTTGVTLETNGLLINASNGQLVGTVYVYTGPNGGTTPVTIAPNSEATFTAMYNYTSLLEAGNYYIKFTTTSGYTIQSPTVYVS